MRWRMYGWFSIQGFPHSITDSIYARRLSFISKTGLAIRPRQLHTTNGVHRESWLCAANHNSWLNHLVHPSYFVGRGRILLIIINSISTEYSFHEPWGQHCQSCATRIGAHMDNELAGFTTLTERNFNHSSQLPIANILYLHNTYTAAPYIYDGAWIQTM